MQDIMALAILLLAAKLAGELAIRSGFSAIIGELLAGILLGPALFGYLLPSPFLDEFSNIGILIMLFLLGLSTKHEELGERVGVAATIGFIGAIVPLALTYAAMHYLFQFPIGESLILSAILSSSTTTISTRILIENGYIQTKTGRMVLATAITDDITDLILLTAILNYLAVGVFQLRASFEMAFLVAGFVFIVLKSGPSLFSAFNLFERMRSEYSLVTIPFAVLLIFASLAEKFQIAGAIGAFLAGMVMNKIPQVTSTLAEKIRILGYALFIPVFFANIGLHAITIADANWYALALLLIIAFAAKYYSTSISSRYFGYDGRVMGWCMVPRGEMSMVVAQLALARGMMSETLLFYAIAVVIITSIAGTVFIKKYTRMKAYQ